MLDVKNLQVHYGVIAAVRGIDMHIDANNIVTLIGSNGAGKTSTLHAIVNSVKKKGQVLFDGRDISKEPTHRIIREGLTLVPEGRRVFINLSVDENLRMGAFNNDENFERLRGEMYRLFPRLDGKKQQLAGTLSGGEQQMLAIARALMSEPKLLMLDEPSLGLAPKIVGEVFEIITELKKRITILLIEQNAFAALKIADYGYVLENGSITLEGKAADLIGNDEVRKKYLGG
ncbi:ABC transporter ATP-binding protein [Nitratifractor sp.]|uniref:ABC transporter ATP-binding protein n=1 Tax=Nitratifractor sp. TaxID=2268144 RepID=UPI0025FA8416|nr:ABC transporter ATP-binding protein [Nitratifractor sp.]